MTTQNMLEYITADTGNNPDYVIIWLHGLGADGHDFEPVVPQFKNPSLTLNLFSRMRRCSR